MKKWMRWMEGARKKPTRKRKALRMMGGLVILLFLCSALNLRNLTEDQAKKDVEAQRGWGTLRLISEKECEDTLWFRRKVQLYTIDESCVYVDMRWPLWDGWIGYPMTLIEPEVDRPVQTGINNLTGSDMLYVVGFITDDSVGIEDITYRLIRSEYEEQEVFMIRPEDCIVDGGRTYFLRQYKMKEPTSADTWGFSNVYIQVLDDNGNPILWDDGPIYEEKDWVRVEPIYILKTNLGK